MTLSLNAGQVIDRFTLIEPLGAGGQAQVWKARDRLPPHDVVAIKCVSLHGEALSSPDRMRREAYSLARLEHPGLVKCRGIFEDLTLDLLGVVLEFVDGTPLDHALGDPRMTLHHREQVLLQVATAMAYLHDNGVVYRDLKPENVVVGASFWSSPTTLGNIKLVDFGIAVPPDQKRRLTSAMTVIGTTAYLAPEMLDPGTWGGNLEPTPRGDVFAFGIFCWHVLATSHPTGLAPDASNIDVALAYRSIRSGDRPWPPALQHRWAGVIRDCLTLAPERRTQTFAQVVAKMNGAQPSGDSREITVEASPLSVRASPRRTQLAPGPYSHQLSMPPARAGTPPGATSPPPGQRGAPPSSRSVIPGLALVMMGTAGIGAAYHAYSSPKEPLGDPSPPEPTSTPVAPTYRPESTTPKRAVASPPSHPAPPSTTEAATGCACDPSDAMVPCGSMRPTSGLPCRDMIPADHTYRLRLSNVYVQDRGKEVELSTVDPGAEVEFCLAGTRQCARSNAAFAHPPRCGDGVSLAIKMADFTSRGLDITVWNRAGSVIAHATGVRHAGLLERALCKGVMFPKSKWPTGEVTRMGFVLDEP